METGLAVTAASGRGTLVVSDTGLIVFVMAGKKHSYAARRQRSTIIGISYH